MKREMYRQLAGGLLLALSAAGFAQSYPVRPLRIVVPYAPGGPTDIVARLVGQKLSDDIGQPVIVDNRAGAGGLVGTALVAKATPDGYTLLLCSSGPMVVSPALGEKLPYDPARDLAPLSLIVTIPYLLLVNAAAGPSSVKELISLAEKNPGKLNFGSAGPATTSYFAAELFRSMARINMVHIPYKGSSQSANELAGGQVHMIFEAIPAALPLVKAGRLRILAVSTAQRVALMPEVPTVAESALPGYEVNTWSGICTTGGTPQGIVARLSGLLVKVAGSSELRERFSVLGAVTMAYSHQQFSEFIRREQVRWAKLVRAAKSN